MDFENYWSNSTDDISATLWRNSPQYAPLCFQENSYIPQTAINSFINPCYPRSPEYHGLNNCLPEAYVENDINERNNYHLYYPEFSRVNSRAFHSLNGNEACSFNMQQMEHLAQSNYQNMKMYSHPCMMKSYDKTSHLKTKSKKKEKPKWHKGKKTPSNISASNTPISENQEKFQNDINSVLNCTLNNKSTQNKQIDELNEISKTDQNYLVPRNSTTSFCETKNEPNMHTSSFANNSDQSVDSNCLYNGNANSILKAENLTNDEQIPAIANPDNNTEFIIKNEVNYFSEIKISEPFKNSATEIVQDTLNNDNSQTQKIYLECKENAEEYVLKPIFEGKDENGEDIVVFRKEVTKGAGTETTIHSENNEMLNSLEFRTNSGGHDAINDEHFSEMQAERPQIDQNKQDESAIVFYSNISDYASEEVVETSEKCVNADNIKAAQSTNEDKEKIKEKINRKRKFNESNSSADTISATNLKINNTSNDSSDTSNELNTNYECGNANFKQHKQELERKISIRRTFDEIQKVYFRKFMSNLKFENKHIKDNTLWHTLNIILNEVGGNVMQSMHKAFNSVIKTQNKSSNQKFMNTPLKKNKKPLQVKLMFKGKKDKQPSNFSKV